MVHKGLWEQIDKLDPKLTAQRAKCRYVDEQGRYVVRLLNKEYVIDPGERQIFLAGPTSGQKETGFIEQLCLLAYLINAHDLPLADKLVKPEALPSGQFFFRGLHSPPTKKLEKVFGRCPERLYRIAGRFDAEKCEFGDASIRLYLLPRIPLTIVVWRSDDEFGARASILFDRTAVEQMPLDALLAAVNLAVDGITAACEKTDFPCR
jgi:hypothetical protein